MFILDLKNLPACREEMYLALSVSLEAQQLVEVLSLVDAARALSGLLLQGPRAPRREPCQ
jgi:hypothetical protein